MRAETWSAGYVAELEHAAMLVRRGRVVDTGYCPEHDELPERGPRPPPDAPPVADRRPVTTEHLGRSRTDEYDWLRAKDDPEVTAYLEAENAWTAARTAHLADLREQLFEEIRARTKETDLSVPSRNRGWWYYGRSFEGREYGASCRVAVTDDGRLDPAGPAEDCGPDEPALPGEEVLLDHDALARDHDFYSVGGISVSPDGTLLAYSTDTVGNERYVLQVKDLATGDAPPRPDRGRARRRGVGPRRA